MFREIRRQNRVLEGDRITELLNTSEFGFLSLGTSENGYAYGIPISYAYEEETNSLFFHCALEGQKLDEIKKNNKISFCVVGKTNPIANEFTTLYESVIAFGDAHIDLSDDEKRKALRLLVKKYSAGFEEIAEKYMDKSWNRTAVFKIEIKHITAKAKY
ncbi:MULTISPECIES: pyridoxamine 5'-phosphate oxidase family protein [unclassified Dysgonomonas]|uniref:pyridoxamine 5'-phosphate oxidase family protein n=1 Tax=unclassified Dysgonomonas TaxID=2630389 RepID=UPI000680324D|nr:MULTISPECIES: pyridoxamine 5'-phosphate oxidase family protein [unclassified Dysgonomonas]MBD8348256.1 pyridoxamine 5'-phosphate oxidase family protein [Dysgonomonas sp. HGC4]MBF0575766.1 pyridoxamine 5'-phosphate oxidase family protein [Dysgonomonas sp. GY617]